MENTNKILNITREYKIGSTESEGIAAAETDLIECECCGRKISRVSVLTSGLQVGSECATYLTRPDLRTERNFVFPRRNKKADKYLTEHGYR